MHDEWRIINVRNTRMRKVQQCRIFCDQGVDEDAGKNAGILLLYTAVPTLSSNRHGAVKNGRPHAGPSERSHGGGESCRAQSMRKVWVCDDEESEK